MRSAWIVFRKEVIDTLRDRRTLIMAVVMPVVLFPVLLYAMTAFSESQNEEARARTLAIGLVRSGGDAAAFAEQLRGREDVRVVEGFPADSVRSLVRRDSLDAVFQFADGFDRTVAGRAPGQLTLFYKTGSDVQVERERLDGLVAPFREQLTDARLAALGIDRQAIEPLSVQRVDVATTRESIGQLVGGFLPYIFLIFCFLGGMYPAIDLGAGEKERHTMETLLTAPASRFQLAMGKFAVIAAAGLASALLAIGGLYVGVQVTSGLPGEIAEVVQGVLRPTTVLLLAALLVPLAMFFAGVQLVVSLYAKSFKEAQSIFGPLNIAVILPAALGLLPGMTLTPVTALVPVLNVALATKAIVAGTVETVPLLLTFVSLIVLALAAVAASAYYFNRESILFRT